MNSLIATGSSPMYYIACKGNLRICLNFLRGFINEMSYKCVDLGQLLL